MKNIVHSIELLYEHYGYINGQNDSGRTSPVDVTALHSVMGPTSSGRLPGFDIICQVKRAHTWRSYTARTKFIDMNTFEQRLRLNQPGLVGFWNIKTIISIDLYLPSSRQSCQSLSLFYCMPANSKARQYICSQWHLLFGLVCTCYTGRQQCGARIYQRK